MNERDVRKMVTILFSDLVDSSRLSVQLDPEALKGLLSRYFEEMSAVVERHGGIVEKYIGDAIMAVFGVPVLHEDDALRAVRAAVEMRETLAILNHDLEAGWGVRLADRIGVNTGEVIAGDHSQGHLFVTGEAVNVAKRLEEAAATERDPDRGADAQAGARRGRGRAERAARAQARRDDPRPRLVEVLAHAPGHARRFDSPFVGPRTPARRAAHRVRAMRSATGPATC